MRLGVSGGAQEGSGQVALIQVPWRFGESQDLTAEELEFFCLLPYLKYLQILWFKCFLTGHSDNVIDIHLTQPFLFPLFVTIILKVNKKRADSSLDVWKKYK